MKKETLEDFTKEVLQDEFFTNIAEYGKAERLIEIGAKWQQERSYSKEEVETIAKDAYTMGRNNILIGVFNKWFEQFKKK
jgi:hypothetical protein